MSVTPRADLAGVLPVIISGGRPALSERPTIEFLPALAGVTAAPVWVVRDDHAGEYERDGHEIVAYSRDWAEEYAAGHWTGLEPYRRGAFLGGFAGREWACRVAAERGHWAVLQLDDNLIWLVAFTGYHVSKRITYRRGGLALFADLLAAVTLATNSAMTGAALDAVSPSAASMRQIARAGFPYSLFIERTGPGREEWHGPYEDDILHAWQYAMNATPATAAIIPGLHYKKEIASKTGMRAHYTHSRAAGLQRAAPQMASMQAIARHAGGRGEPRVFHRMRPRAIAAETPLMVTDRELFTRVTAALSDLAAEVAAAFRADRRAYWEARAAKHGPA